jgi:hypothetical protein
VVLYDCSLGLINPRFPGTHPVHYFHSHNLILQELAVCFFTNPTTLKLGLVQFTRQNSWQKCDHEISPLPPSSLVILRHCVYYKCHGAESLVGLNQSTTSPPISLIYILILSSDLLTDTQSYVTIITWMMSRNGFWRSRLWPIQGIIGEFPWREWENQRKMCHYNRYPAGKFCTVLPLHQSARHLLFPEARPESWLMGTES